MTVGWYGGEWIEGATCEDAPCCGCCGGSTASDGYDSYDEMMDNAYDD